MFTVLSMDCRYGCQKNKTNRYRQRHQCSIFAGSTAHAVIPQGMTLALFLNFFYVNTDKANESQLIQSYSNIFANLSSLLAIISIFHFF